MWSILQAAVASSLAYLVAEVLVGSCHDLVSNGVVGGAARSGAGGRDFVHEKTNSSQIRLRTSDYSRLSSPTRQLLFILEANSRGAAAAFPQNAAPLAIAFLVIATLLADWWMHR